MLFSQLPNNDTSTQSVSSTTRSRNNRWQWFEAFLVLHDDHLVAALLNGGVVHFVAAAAVLSACLRVVHLVVTADLCLRVVAVAATWLEFVYL